MTVILKKIQLCFYFIVLFSVFSCSSSNEKENKNSDETSEYEDLKFTAEQFLYKLYYMNVDDAFLFCDNASKSSVKKLSNQFSYFNAKNLESIDTCIIDNKNAYCNCIFVNSENLKFEKKLYLKKYGKDWLVHFILDENFDNIYVYDYSYEKLTTQSKSHLSFSDTQKEHIRTIFKRINSNDIIINFSTIEDIKKADLYATEMINKSFNSEIIDENLKIEANYYQENNNLYSVIHDLFIENHKDYYQSFLDIAVDELGMPFNVPENTSQKDLSSFKSLRWFVKSYNELVTVHFYTNYINIYLQQIP